MYNPNDITELKHWVNQMVVNSAYDTKDKKAILRNVYAWIDQGELRGTISEKLVEIGYTELAGLYL